MGRKSVGGAAGGKHASARSTVDEYRRQIGRYDAHRGTTKHMGRHSVRAHHSEHKRNWKLIIFAVVLLLILLSGFYVVFAVEIIEAATKFFSK